MVSVTRIEAICDDVLDDRALRSSVLDVLRMTVPFDAYVWLITDPETCVGCSPMADVPAAVHLPTVIGAKYRATANRWTALAPNTAVTWATATDDGGSGAWRQTLSVHGIDDVMSTVLRDRFGCWGFLDLWRAGGTFTADECAVVGEMARVVTPALRRSLLPTFAAGASAAGPAAGPAVLMLSEQLELLGQTPRTDAYLRVLLPTEAERAPVPAAVLNVAAQLLAREEGVDDHPASARTHLAGGAWVTLRADRLDVRPAMGATIAVSIEPSTPAERVAVYAAVAALTEREAEVLHHVASGATTRELASRLFVSEHTVQDHLKSVFAKTGVNSRSSLVARATGVSRA